MPKTDHIRLRWLGAGLLFVGLVVGLAQSLQHGSPLRGSDYFGMGIGLAVLGLVVLWIARRMPSPWLRSSAYSGIAAGVSYVVLGIAVVVAHGLS